MIWTQPFGPLQNVQTITIGGDDVPPGNSGNAPVTGYEQVTIEYAPTAGNIEDIIFNTSIGEIPARQVLEPADLSDPLAQIWTWIWIRTGNVTVNGYRYRRDDEIPTTKIHIERFQLSNIDDMRELILQHSTQSSAFDVNEAADTIGGNNPYANVLQWRRKCGKCSTE